MLIGRAAAANTTTGLPMRLRLLLGAMHESLEQAIYMYDYSALQQPACAALCK